MKQIVYLVSFLMLLLTACKKDKPEPGPQNVVGVYKITALSAKANGGAAVNLFDQLNECQQNDTWDFQEGGTFRYGGVQTSTCQSDDYTGSWSLNNKSFTITGPQNTTTYQLEKFDGRVLELSTEGTLNGDPARYYISFTKN